MIKSNFSGSRRNVHAMNEDLLIPEWAKKDDNLKERLTEKKTVTKCNPDRLDPLIESVMEIKVRSVRNRMGENSKKGLSGISKSSLTSGLASEVAKHVLSGTSTSVNNEYQTIVEGSSLLTALAFEFE